MRYNLHKVVTEFHEIPVFGNKCYQFVSGGAYGDKEKGLYFLAEVVARLVKSGRDFGALDRRRRRNCRKIYEQHPSLAKCWLLAQLEMV